MSETKLSRNLLWKTHRTRYDSVEPSNVQTNPWRTAELARRLGVEPSTVSRWLNPSDDHEPSLANGLRLAMMLGIQPKAYLDARLRELDVYVLGLGGLPLPDGAYATLSGSGERESHAATLSESVAVLLVES